MKKKHYTFTVGTVEELFGLDRVRRYPVQAVLRAVWRSFICLVTCILWCALYFVGQLARNIQQVLIRFRYDAFQFVQIQLVSCIWDYFAIVVPIRPAFALVVGAAAAVGEVERHFRKLALVQ
ncbi:hypothetical protein T4D_4606 [Trichinella pseudospiralis]|uniref:Caveolin n=1 Tax=Trichinella pseudospiralis TaxID=6337 RepID=A0A0V1FF62_TRIPS|nr:hypothetical protein T4D_4606 [Trichinella pseudospiralis]